LSKSATSNGRSHLSYDVLYLLLGALLSGFFDAIFTKLFQSAPKYKQAILAGLAVSLLAAVMFPIALAVDIVLPFFMNLASNGPFTTPFLSLPLTTTNFAVAGFASMLAGLSMRSVTRQLFSAEDEKTQTISYIC